MCQVCEGIPSTSSNFKSSDWVETRMCFGKQLLKYLSTLTAQMLRSTNLWTLTTKEFYCFKSANRTYVTHGQIIWCLQWMVPVWRGFVVSELISNCWVKSTLCYWGSFNSVIFVLGAHNNRTNYLYLLVMAQCKWRTLYTQETEFWG